MKIAGIILLSVMAAVTSRGIALAQRSNQGKGDAGGEARSSSVTPGVLSRAPSRSLSFLGMPGSAPSMSFVAVPALSSAAGSADSCASGGPGFASQEPAVNLVRQPGQ
ncbi:MAG TPA: hypothetical protein VGC80_03230 [Acetobacteraceae bacterium]|jgi:hypothetical protein